MSDRFFVVKDDGHVKLSIITRFSTLGQAIDDATTRNNRAESFGLKCRYRVVEFPW